MKQFTTYIALALMMLIASCSNDEDVQRIDLPTDDMWVEEDLEGASVTIKPFIAGDAVTRSSLVFGNQSLIFGWNAGDKVGIYPTAMIVTDDESKEGLLDPNVAENRHVSYEENNNLWRTNPTMIQDRSFTAREANGSQTTNIFNHEDDFEWDETGRWTAYYPYLSVNPEVETYIYRTFDFTNQEQNGLVNISAFKKGTDNDKTTGDGNIDYRQSEIRACAHLGTRDVMISPEMSWNSSKINFQMRHVGAVIRLYLLAPKVNLIIDNIKLICDSKIFYEKGAFTLISHPYKANAQDGNYGVNLNLSDKVGCQINPIGEPTNMIQLSFSKTTAAQTVYDATDSYKRYVTAYIMTFPVTYTPVIHGNLFAYVTAHKEGDSSEYHFVSKPLEGKTMESGHYYQFTSSTHADDGLYPIELTATLLPWQDIVGSGINADLEK